MSYYMIYIGYGGQYNKETPRYIYDNAVGCDLTIYYQNKSEFKRSDSSSSQQ